MESKRSMCSPVTCCGMPMEQGCFIFAVLNAVFCSLCTISSLGFLGFVISWFFDGESRGPNDMVLVWFFLGISLTCSLGSIIALAFAVVLCVGVTKNKPCYIMSYFVYGIVVVVSSVLGVIAFVCLEWGNMPIVLYTLIPLGVCALYSGPLVLVYQTHAVLTARTPVTAHRRLLNKENC